MTCRFPDGKNFNPFAASTPLLTSYERAKSKILFPVACVRLLFCVGCMVAAGVWASIGLRCARWFSKDKKNMHWFFMRMIQFSARMMLHGMGYHTIKIRGKVDPRARVIVSNHVALADGFAIMYTHGVTCVSKKDNVKLPLLGGLLQALDAILVDRMDPESRHKTIDAIKQKANSSAGSPPLLIFPEGTCTNGHAIVSFKPGGFIPGVAVQPVVLHYPFAHFDVGFTDNNVKAGFGKFVLRHLWQFNNHLEIEILPLYEPNAAEKKDPMLFANNVRKEMGKALGVTLTEHSYDDVLLAADAVKASLPGDAALLEMAAIKDLHSIGLKDARTLLQRFAKLDLDKTGTLNLGEFSKGLGLDGEGMHIAEAFFNLLDMDETGEVNFREFVLGMMNLSRKRSQEEMVTLIYDFFDLDHDGCVTLEEFLGRTENSAKLEKLFRSVDKDGDGVVTRAELEEYAREKPEALQFFAQRIEGLLGASRDRSLSAHGSVSMEESPLLKKDN